MIRTLVTMAGVVAVLVASSFMIVAVSSTLDLITNSPDSDGQRPRVVVVGSEGGGVEWLSNTIHVYSDKLLGRLKSTQKLEYLLVSAKFVNATGDVCESSFDYAPGLDQGEIWEFRIPYYGCQVDKVLLSAKSF